MTDSAGNTAREVRGVFVYDSATIQLQAYNPATNERVRVQNNARIGAGTIEFGVIGVESDEYVMKYLPGSHKLSAFKAGGQIVSGGKATLTTPGVYTFYVRDREMRTFIGQLEIVQPGG